MSHLRRFWEKKQKIPFCVFESISNMIIYLYLNFAGRSMNGNKVETLAPGNVFLKGNVVFFTFDLTYYRLRTKFVAR